MNWPYFRILKLKLKIYTPINVIFVIIITVICYLTTNINYSSGNESLRKTTIISTRETREDHPAYRATKNNGSFVFPVHCVPFKEDVFYLKVHKTGSSTLNMILYGVARHHNLTVVPVDGDPFPDTITSRFITRRTPKARDVDKFNILAEHIRYHERAVSRVTHQGNFRFASLRHPYPHLKSFFAEFSMDRRFGIQNKADPVAYILAHSSLLKRAQGYANIFNIQSREFGISSGMPPRRAIQYIEEQFDFIAISEYLDQSLVLLRRILCWEIKDIVYITLRQRTYKSKHEEPTLATLTAHQNRSVIDYKIYDYFLSKLNKTLENQGHDFTEEVSKFQSMNTAISMFCSRILGHVFKNPECIYSHAANRTHIWLDPYPFGQPFLVYALDCAVMKLRTRVHRNLLKIRHYPAFCMPTTPRLRPKAIHTDIHWKGPYAVIHPLYCDTSRSQWGIPLGVLATRQSYMWTS